RPQKIGPRPFRAGGGASPGTAAGGGGGGPPARTGAGGRGGGATGRGGGAAGRGGTGGGAAAGAGRGGIGGGAAVGAGRGRGRGGALGVEDRAVGAPLIDHVPARSPALDARVLAGERAVPDHDVAGRIAADEGLVLGDLHRSAAGGGHEPQVGHGRAPPRVVLTLSGGPRPRRFSRGGRAIVNKAGAL